MFSQAFRRALSATGYLTAAGQPLPGLVRAQDPAPARLRAVLRDSSVGLNADAIFSAQSTPAAIFKDSGKRPPTVEEIQTWHEAAWNVGVAPLLWIITPTEIRLYDCYASPRRDDRGAGNHLGQFELASDERLHALDAMCGRLATETGEFWSSAIGSRIDRRHRVDRELLGEINALEEFLTELPAKNDEKQSALDAKEIRAARDFAQRLIGRCIFTWYLLDRNIAQRFLPPMLQCSLAEIFSNSSRAFLLFEWLRKTFNGDLFPMDDPGSERTRLGPKHLALIRDFIEGRSLVRGARGQGRLFQFRFNAIPVDLISSIYQQFARSSAADEARVQGLHYTPVELVHLTLDAVFEDLPATARIIDPTCGSGTFLVEAFRRLVWRNSPGKPASRTIVRKILYERLFGIDINRSALGIAAFSLYLAALEFDHEPITDIADLRFDRLIGTTLFEADTIRDNLPPALTQSPFDAVVGNPPWTFDSKQKAKRRKPEDEDTQRPRRSPDQSFLNVAAVLAGESGRIGMVMKASPFFSKDAHAIAARSAVLHKMRPAAIVNLSALRREDLFPDAVGPALLFFARCTLMPRPGQLLVGSVPWSPDFRRNGVFNVGPAELRTIQLTRVLETPAILKAATFGTVRDTWLIERLEREFPALDKVLTDIGLRPIESRGQGYQVKGDRNVAPTHFRGLKELTPDSYTPFRLRYDLLNKFSHRTLHRPREASIYRGPLLICPKACFRSAPQLGRYTAAVSPTDLLYTESFYGISFARSHDPALAFVIAGVLNSSLSAFQLAFGGGTWGLERATVEPNDLLSIRVPDLRGAPTDVLARIVEAEARAGKRPDPESLAELDEAVAELYELEREERVLANESVERARMLIFEGRSHRQASLRPPSPDILKAYASSVVSVVDTYLRTRGERHLEATIYSRALFRASWEDGVSGLTTVRFAMVPGAPKRTPAIKLSDGAELDHLAERLRGRLEADVPPYLNERRQLRLYLSNELYVLKPSELRCWTRTVGLNDADIILGDHWLAHAHAANA